MAFQCLFRDIFSTFALFYNQLQIKRRMFRIPTITKNLLIINVLMFAATYVFGLRGINLTDYLGLHFVLSDKFNAVQLVTYMFMHGGIEHIFFNMFAVWMFGCTLENVWGPKRFLTYYIVCGIGAGLIQEAVTGIHYYTLIQGISPEVLQTIHNEGARLLQQNMNYSDPQLYNINMTLNSGTVGASGAIFAILLGFGMLFPDERMFIFPLPVPIKAKYFVIGYAAIELALGLANNPSDNVAHFAHLGGMLFGYILIRYWRNNPGGGFGRSRGHQFFDNLKNNWERRSHRKADFSSHEDNVRRESDWDYNARRKAEQDEIDRILDKVRHSGYDSLTNDEKRKLFDSGSK